MPPPPPPPPPPPNRARNETPLKGNPARVEPAPALGGGGEGALCGPKCSPKAMRYAKAIQSGDAAATGEGRRRCKVKALPALAPSSASCSNARAPPTSHRASDKSSRCLPEDTDSLDVASHPTWRARSRCSSGSCPATCADSPVALRPAASSNAAAFAGGSAGTRDEGGAHGSARTRMRAARAPALKFEDHP